MDKIKLVAFDMYDTWISITNKTNPYKTAFKKLWLEKRRKELAYILVTSPKDIQEILPEETKNHKDFSNIMEELEKNIQKEINSIKIYPDFFSTIEFLKYNGYKTAVISNLAKPYAQPLYQANTQWIFDYKLLSFEIWSRKPEKEIFQELQKQSWIWPKETIMIGDSLISDIQWAQNIGIEAIQISRKQIENTETNTHHIISTLAQIKDILKYWHI